MNCKRCKNLINVLPDNMLSDNKLRNVKDHIANCDDCRKHYDVILMMIDDLHNIMEVDLPKGFENRLHFALERAPAVSKRKQMLKRLKIASIVVGAMVVVFGAVSIAPMFGAKKSNDFAAQESMPMKASEMYDVKESKDEEAKAVPKAPSMPTEQSKAQKTDDDAGDNAYENTDAGNGEPSDKDGYSALSYARDRHIESVEFVEEVIAALKDDEYLRLYINSDSADKDNFIDSIFDDRSTKSTYWNQLEHKRDEYVIISRFNEQDIADIIFSMDMDYVIEDFGVTTKEQLSDYEIDINEYMTDGEYILIIFVK